MRAVLLAALVAAAAAAKSGQLGRDGHGQQQQLGRDGHGQQHKLGEDGHGQQQQLGRDGHGQHKHGVDPEEPPMGGDDHDKRPHETDELQFVGVEDEAEADEPRHHHLTKRERMLRAGFQGITMLLVLLVVRAEIKRRDALREARGEAPLMQTYTGAWRHNLCSCFSYPATCLKALCCYRLMEGLNTAELDGREFSYMDALCGACNPLLSWYNRRKIQQARNIAPEPVCDAVKVVCCAPCVAGQHMLELSEGLRADEEAQPVAIVMQGEPVGVPDASVYPAAAAQQQQQYYYPATVVDVPVVKATVVA